MSRQVKIDINLQFCTTKRSLPPSIFKEAKAIVLNASLNDLDRAVSLLLQQLQPGQLHIALELEAPALRILVEFPQQVVTSNITPLSHWLGNQLHVLELLKILQHGRFARPNVSFNADNKWSAGAVLDTTVVHTLHDVTENNWNEVHDQKPK